MTFDSPRKMRSATRPLEARAILPAILFALFLTVGTGYSFTALYVFGDSLSDTGRSPAPSPSYYNGRYSNGSLWVEYLSTQLGFAYNASNNFAVSGSTTSDLQSEIAALPASTNLHSGLFSILSGGNDFLNNLGLGTNDAAWSVVISNAVKNLTNAVGTLYTNGAREVLLGNLPDLGRIPEVLATPAGYPAYISAKVAAFNSQLASAVTNVSQRSPGLRIYLEDNFTFFNGILNAPGTYGFTVTTKGALEDSSLSDKSFTGPGANYVFWDIIHPTTKMHALLAALALQNTGVRLTVAPNGTNVNLQILNLYPGQRYGVQSSTNLIAWTDYNAITASNTNATLTVTNAPGTKVFYRVGY